jgi:hypothetical protein
LTWLVGLIAVHSILVGAGLLFFTRDLLRFAGWSEIGPAFFPRQAGIFHVVVAVGYLIERFRYGGVSFLVFTKCAAVCFLLAMMLSGPVSWAVPCSAALDALMAAAVGLFQLRVTRGPRSGATPRRGA